MSYDQTSKPTNYYFIYKDFLNKARLLALTKDRKDYFKNYPSFKENVMIEL